MRQGFTDTPGALKLVFVLFAVLVLCSVDDAHEEVASEYCSMITLHLKTNGEAGWPAYNGTTSCPNFKKESSNDRRNH